MPAPTLTHNPIPRPRWSLKPDGPWRCHRCGELITRAQVPGTDILVWVHIDTKGTNR